MPQFPVGAQGAEEGLLVGILRRLRPQQPTQLAEHGIAMLLVERFEWWDLHYSHHLL